MTPAEKNPMDFGPKRCHFLFIFENFFKDFTLLIIALIIGLLQGDMDIILENVGVLVVVLIGPIGKISRFLTTLYSVDRERLIVKSGLFQKNNLEVPLSTITTVDFSQNILHRIFGVYRLNIDNASNISSVNTRINATFRKEDAVKIRSLLILGRDGLDGLNTARASFHAADNANCVDRRYSTNSADSTNSTDCTNSADAASLNGHPAFLPSDPGSVSASKHNYSVKHNYTAEHDYTADNSPDTGQKRQIRIRASDLILMGLLKTKGTFFAEVIVLIITGFTVFNISLDSALAIGISDLISLIGLTGFLLIGAALIILIASLCGMAGSLIRYYGFTVTDNGQAVKIEYGLLTKKRYTIQKNRISGFLYQQSFLSRMFKTGTLQLFAIGYGQGDEESTSEEPILFPLIKENRVRSAMSEILPETEETSACWKAAKGSLRYFFYGIGFIAALISLCSSIWASCFLPHCDYLWLVGLIILFYSIAGRLQEYKNAAIYGNESNFSISCGGFKRNTVFVKTSHIESLSAKAGRLKAKKGIVSITVSYIAPITSAAKVAKNVPISCFEDIRKKLIY